MENIIDVSNANDQKNVTIEKTAEKTVEKKASPKKATGDNSIPTGWQPVSARGEKSVFGHRLGTLAATMDDLLNSGKYTADECVKRIVKTCEKTVQRAEQALAAHMAYLPNAKGWLIIKNDTTKVLKAVKYQPQAKGKGK